MNNSNLYRTLFLLDDTRNFTNDFYVAEFAKIVLFKQDGVTLDIEKIQEEILNLTELEYTEEDILRAIAKWCKDDIEESNGEYSLKRSAFTEISKREKANNIYSYIHRFLSENKEKYTLTKDDAEKLIDKFIYQRFNENLQQISDILNHRLAIDDIVDDYSDDEKAFVNDFLHWDNFEKNKCVYTLIAKSYDYCMINSKCADSSFDFSKIHFYVDTNIIFRLLGLNGSLREASVKSLIDKSRAAGIQLTVSNFVKAECNHTINSQLQLLIDTTSGLNSLLPPSSMSFAEERSIKTAFYTKYYRWVKDGNKHKNYEGFRKYITKEFDSILSGFVSDDGNSSYKIKPGIDFHTIYESLYQVKRDKHTVETDINSFLLVFDKRKENPNQEYFMVSADGKLITWLRDAYPDAKSIAEFPSTWLSIVLKYKGRERESDYKAFCQFIHLSIEPKVEDLEKKLEVKSLIVHSDLSDQIKVEMIEEVKNNYGQYQELKPRQVVRLAYGKTEEEIKKDAIRQKDEEYARMVDGIFQRAEDNYKALQEKAAQDRDADRKKYLEDRHHQQTEHEKEMKQLREDSAAAEESARQEGYQKAKDEMEQERKRRKEEKVKKRIERNKRIRFGTSLALVIATIIFIAVLVVFWLIGGLNKPSPFGAFCENNALFFSILFGSIEVLTGAIKGLTSNMDRFSTEDKIVSEWIEKEMNK